VQAFLNSSILNELHLWGASAIIVGAARKGGYRVDIGSLAREGASDDEVRVTMDVSGVGTPVARYRGFSVPVIGSGNTGLDSVVAFFDGIEPTEVLLHEAGPARDVLLQNRGGVRVVDHVTYPERV
jgi:hypothetical protein